LIWYIAENGQQKKMAEEVLLYKIENSEISPETLVVNAEIKNWIPLEQTLIWKENAPIKQRIFEKGQSSTTSPSKQVQQQPIKVWYKVWYEKWWAWVIIAILLLLIIASLTPLLTSKSGRFVETKSNMENIVFKGIDENSVPLAVTDLKLVQEEESKYGSDTFYSYTVIGTLKKNSTDPKEGFFDFSVTLIDKNGKYLETKHTDTKPSPFWGNDKTPLFTYGSTYHFELELSYLGTDPPVAVEFSQIKEFNKAEFILVSLDEVKDYITKEYYGDAIRIANKVLEFDPNNAEAKALIEQITPLEAEKKANEDNKQSNISIATEKPASNIPVATENTQKQEPKWYRAEGFQASIGANLYYGTGDDRAYVGKVLSIKDFSKNDSPDGTAFNGMYLEMYDGSYEWKDRMVVYNDSKWSVKAEDLSEEAKKTATPN
jgi:hypothetical protein